MSMPAISRNRVGDAELLSALSQGDLGALGVLFDRYAQDLHRVVIRLGVRPSDVDDIVQSTFLEVARAAARFDGRASARAWIVGHAVILVRRHHRSLSRLAGRLARFAREPTGSVRPAVPPDDALEQQQRARRAKAALAKLSTKKRAVFVMFALEGYSGEEVAQALSIPVATVWTCLHHARKELKQHLSAEEL